MLLLLIFPVSQAFSSLNWLTESLVHCYTMNIDLLIGSLVMNLSKRTLVGSKETKQCELVRLVIVFLNVD